MYSECKKCKRYSDDGASLSIQGKSYHFCIDCADEVAGMSDDELSRLVAPPPKRKTKTSAAVKDRYNKKAYDDIKLRVRKGNKEFLQSEAERAGMSLNGYITACTEGKKPGMYLTGTKDELTKMLSLFNSEKKFTYVYHIANGEIFADATAIDLINSVNNDTSEIIAIQIFA